MSINININRFVEYRIPVRTYISNSQRKLYKLEEQRDQILERISDELKEIYGFNHRFKEAFPQVIFDLLDSYENYTSIAACIGFLESLGLEVTLTTLPSNTTYTTDKGWTSNQETSPTTDPD